jgi:hypothetical protein
MQSAPLSADARVVPAWLPLKHGQILVARSFSAEMLGGGDWAVYSQHKDAVLGTDRLDSHCFMKAHGSLLRKLSSLTRLFPECELLWSCPGTLYNALQKRGLLAFTFQRP